MPVTLPTVNSQINRTDHSRATLAFIVLLTRFNSQVNTLTLVGILIMIVAVEKYTFESVSIPTEYIWWAQTTNPRKPILMMDQTMP